MTIEMGMRLNMLAIAVGAVLMLPAGSASAEVRSGSVTDPTDATSHQNVDGTSYRDQDIQRVTASYDTAGSITMTFYFLDPVPASTTNQLKARLSNGSCRGGTPTGTAHVTVRPSSEFYPTVVVLQGYDGAIQATRTLSSDHRAITIRASAAVLANREYGCVDSISLSHDVEVWDCTVYACDGRMTVTTDDADAFSIDAATPAIATPEPEATAAPTDTVIPADRCGPAEKTLRTKLKQVKKLKAQWRSARKRARKMALAKQIKATKRVISKKRDVILLYC